MGSQQQVPRGRVTRFKVRKSELEVVSKAEEKHFRSLIIKRYLLDTSKMELETVARLITFYEGSNGTPRLNKVVEAEQILRKTYRRFPSKIGYSKEKYQKENEQIKGFLTQFESNTSIDPSYLKKLRSVISKRLLIINKILERYDIEAEIERRITKRTKDKKQEQTFMEDMKTTGEGIELREREEPSKPRHFPKKNKKKNKDAETKDEDSDMEADSVDDDENRELYYRKVLERKENMDKEMIKRFYLKFVRKEINRIKSVLRLQTTRMQNIINPNRLQSGYQGFTETFLNILKKRKEDLPFDIREDLIRFLPDSCLKEFGNDLFIEDLSRFPHRFSEVKEKKRFKEDEQKWQGSGVPEKQKKAKEIDDMLAKALGLDEKQAQEMTTDEKIKALESDPKNLKARKEIERNGYLMRNGRLQRDRKNQVDADNETSLRNIKSREKTGQRNGIDDIDVHEMGDKSSSYEDSSSYGRQVLM